MVLEISEKVKFIHRAMCRVDRIYSTLLKRAEMTDSEYTLLTYMFFAGEDCSQKDIADNTYISPKTLNSTVKKLEQKGIIKLTPGKYPYRYIALTTKGHEYANERIIPAIETEKSILESISNEDFENFVSLAKRYIKMFEEKIEPNL